MTAVLGKHILVFLEDLLIPGLLERFDHAINLTALIKLRGYPDLLLIQLLRLPLRPHPNEVGGQLLLLLIGGALGGGITLVIFGNKEGLMGVIRPGQSFPLLFSFALILFDMVREYEFPFVNLTSTTFLDQTVTIFLGCGEVSGLVGSFGGEREALPGGGAGEDGGVGHTGTHV